MSLRILNVAYPHAPVRPDSVGGAEQVLSQIDAALVARGHHSCVLACDGSQTSGRLFAIPCAEGEIDEQARAAAWAQYRDRIGRIVEAERIDVVHLHGVDFDRYAPQSAPTLATLHLPLDWYDARIWSLPAHVHLHCVSDHQHAGGAHARLLPPIANGVASIAAAGVKRRGYCLMLARICPEKGVHLALRAAHAARAPLLIAGQIYPYREHLDYFRDEVAPLLDARRRFIGPVHGRAKARLLAGAKALLAPSLAPETSSLVAMEALAAGAPVIAFASGALPRIVEDGRTGRIVANVEEMAQAIGEVGAIDGGQCRRQARERFGQERMIAEYLDVYARLARSAA